MDGRADIVGFGRDADQHSWWRVHRRLVAAATGTALICAGITLGLLRSGRPQPLARAAQEQTMAVLLRGAPFHPDPRLGTLLLGGGAELRLLNVRGDVPGLLGLAHDMPTAWQSPIGPTATIREIASVAGGAAVLLGDGGNTGQPAIGDVFFIPLTSRGAGAPRLIARANYLAVALNRRDIWVEQAGARSSRAWLTDESGRRLSAVLKLHDQVLLGATVRGLLTQGPSGEGASLVSPDGGVFRPAGVPWDALVVAVGPDDVAWQAAYCRGPCSLNITSLRDGGDTVIPLPPRTLPVTYDPPPAAFDLAGQRLALAMEITNREDRTTGTSVYVADIGMRRLIRLPGGPIPLSTNPTVVGAVPAVSPDAVSLDWAGPGLWIVASNGDESQAAYWAGAGPLRVTAPMSGGAYPVSVASGATATSSG
jgi:hypothetical protein